MGLCASINKVHEPEEFVNGPPLPSSYKHTPTAALRHKNKVAFGARAGPPPDEPSLRPSTDSCRPSSEAGLDGDTLRAQAGLLHHSSDSCIIKLEDGAGDPGGSDNGKEEESGSAGASSHRAGFVTCYGCNDEQSYALTSVERLCCARGKEEVAAVLSQMQLGPPVGHCGRALVYRSIWCGDDVAVTITDHRLPDDHAAAWLEHTVTNVLCSPALEHPNLAAVRCCAMEKLSGDTSYDDDGAENSSDAQLDCWGDPICSSAAGQMTWAKHLQGAKTHKEHHILVWTISDYHSLGTLEAVMKRWRHTGQRLAWRDILATLQDVASGLSHMHKHSLAHGHLNTSRVLLFPSNCDPRGFTAKVSTASHLACQVYQYGGAWCDAPQKDMLAHTAPEVALQREVHSPATDAFSFGVLCWELFKCRPATSLKASDLVRSMVLKQPSLPQLHGCPHAFQALVTACTHPEAAERPNFPAILALLEAMLADAKDAQFPRTG